MRDLGTRSMMPLTINDATDCLWFQNLPRRASIMHSLTFEKCRNAHGIAENRNFLFTTTRSEYLFLRLFDKCCSVKLKVSNILSLE